MTASRSALLAALRPLNCETQNLVEAQWLSRNLHFFLPMNKGRRGRHGSVGTYESKVWQNESVLEARERSRGEHGRVRFRSGGDHDGIRTCHGTYPQGVLVPYAVTILDDRHVDHEALYEINDLLEAVDEGALARAHVARAAMKDRKSVV